jgi:hypothetical protein
MSGTWDVGFKQIDRNGNFLGSNAQKGIDATNAAKTFQPPVPATYPLAEKDAATQYFRGSGGELPSPHWSDYPLYPSQYQPNSMPDYRSLYKPPQYDVNWSQSGTGGTGSGNRSLSNADLPPSPPFDSEGMMNDLRKGFNPDFSKWDAMWMKGLGTAATGQLGTAATGEEGYAGQGGREQPYKIQDKNGKWRNGGMVGMYTGQDGRERPYSIQDKNGKWNQLDTAGGGTGQGEYTPFKMSSGGKITGGYAGTPVNFATLLGAIGGRNAQALSNRQATEMANGISASNYHKADMEKMGAMTDYYKSITGLNNARGDSSTAETNASSGLSTKETINMYIAWIKMFRADPNNVGKKEPTLPEFIRDVIPSSNQSSQQQQPAATPATPAKPPTPPRSAPIGAGGQSGRPIHAVED